MRAITFGMMYVLKFILLLASCGTTALLAFSLLWHVPAAWRAPYRWKASGSVVEVIPPPAGDEERVPSSGPRIVVEFTDQSGQPRRQTYNSFNSGGATEFAGKKVGDRVEFTLQIDAPAPGARKHFDWQNAGKMHLALGGTLVVIGVLLYIL